ncbi:envelope stress response membrane protein PspB [Pseudidiomarina sp.]|uniref:envelope stress response membrane protein PspB n=1 Tax=Pseudidiomarina sp. TaxID=2081707 RepID=UPI00299E06CB|nr:envelope stress response membrane protein PspB [Pseudidiomarina sp.]MDX1704928.1 envelope stress response membrane protein PspB [Pseudidiomarina sp.]
MDSIAELMVAPIIIFMVIVAPIWIVMHYRSQRKISQGLSEEEIAQLQMLARQGEQMRERIKTLESILDADSPKWRER